MRKWIQNVTMTMEVDTVSIPTLLKMVGSGRIPAEKWARTRHVDQIAEAYRCQDAARIR